MAHRFSPQEIAFKLELARRYEAAGMSVGQVCKTLGVQELTFLRWYKKYVGHDLPAVGHLRDLEEENARLRSAIRGMERPLQELLGDIEESDMLRGRLSVLPPKMFRANG